GREEAPSPVAPGARPPLLSRQPQPARQVASSAATPPPSAATSRAAAGSATATAVAERSPPAAASAPAAAASTTTTAPPEGEPRRLWPPARRLRADARAGRASTYPGFMENGSMTLAADRLVDWGTARAVGGQVAARGVVLSPEDRATLREHFEQVVPEAESI